MNEGNILYIPKLYWHSVLNLGDSMALSIQSDDDVIMNKGDTADTDFDVTQFGVNGGGSVGHYFVGNGACSMV